MGALRNRGICHDEKQNVRSDQALAKQRLGGKMAEERFFQDIATEIVRFGQNRKSQK